MQGDDDEARHEVDLSRRKFLKFTGMLGLTFGAVSLPSLGWTESTTDANRESEQEPWLEAHKKKAKKGKKASSKKKSASGDGNTDWQEMA